MRTDLGEGAKVVTKDAPWHAGLGTHPRLQSKGVCVEKRRAHRLFTGVAHDMLSHERRLPMKATSGEGYAAYVRCCDPGCEYHTCPCFNLRALPFYPFDTGVCDETATTGSLPRACASNAHRRVALSLSSPTRCVLQLNPCVLIGSV